MSDGAAADLSALRRFSPLDGMKKDNLQALARKVSRHQLPANRGNRANLQGSQHFQQSLGGRDHFLGRLLIPPKPAYITFPPGMKGQHRRA